MEKTQLPWRFPSEADEIREDAGEFQQLTDPEKFRVIFDLAAFGEKLIAASPNRASIEQQVERDEREWQRVQTELFARYGRDISTGS